MKNKIRLKINEKTLEEKSLEFLKILTIQLEKEIKNLFLNDYIYSMKNNKVDIQTSIIDIDKISEDEFILNYEYNITINNELILNKHIKNIQDFSNSNLRDYFISIEDINESIKDFYIRFRKFNINSNNLRKDNEIKTKEEIEEYIKKIPYEIRKFITCFNIDFRINVNNELLYETNQEKNILTINLDFYKENPHIYNDCYELFVYTQKLKIKFIKTYTFPDNCLGEIMLKTDK